MSARMKKIHSKLKALEWSQHFSHYKSVGIFPNAQGRILPNFEPIRDIMVFLVVCKNEDAIKNEGTRVVTTLFIDFSDAQGQITPKSAMEFAEIQTHSSFNSCHSCLQE